jgi:hypothetical protein
MRAHTILAAATFAATAAGAQTTIPKSDSAGCFTTPGGYECRKISGSGANEFRLVHARMDSVMMKRAILGIELRPTGTRRDTLGVFVESVTPKGPAENAGIVEGDRIAAINGVDLRVGAADVDDDYTNGLAAHRLMREVQKLAPGSRVTLRVYSGGRLRDVQITAGRASDFMHEGGFGMMFGGPAMGMMQSFGGPEGMGMEPLRRTMIEDRARGDSAHVIRLRTNMPGAVRLRGNMPPMPAMMMMHRSGTFRI